MRALAEQLATNPRELLQKVVQAAMSLCRADSAGVSILEPGGENGMFRWRAAAGAFARNINGTMPRDASPCGNVLSRNEVLLFDRADRYFPALRGVEPPMYENLLAPWEVDGKPAGTLWAIGHSPERQFDAEDARLLQNLARFAAAAWQTVTALDAATARARELQRVATARARDLSTTTERLRLALDLAELGTWSWDLTTGRGQLDPRAAEIIGVSPGTVDVAAAQLATIHAEDRPRIQAEAAAGATSGAAFDLSYRTVHPDGRIRHVVSRARAVEDASGRAVALVGTNRDVTAERERDARLRQSEERYRLVVESLTDYAIFTLDTEGLVTSWNEGAQRLKGYSAEEIIGQPVARFYTPEDVAAGKPQRELALALRAGRSEDESWRVRKDGTLFWTNEILTPLRADDGCHVGFAKISRDLTERREAEQAIRESEDRLRLLIDSVRDYAIFTLDLDGVITSWNEGAKRVFGYSENEAVGERAEILFTPEDRARGAERAERHEALTTGRGADERWHLKKNGSRFYASGVLTCLVRDGIVTGFAKVARDLTERKQFEDALRRAHEDLEERINRRTAELAAMMKRLVSIQEDERRRIARDLHDDIGQRLTVVHLKLQALRQGGGDSRAHEQLQELQHYMLSLDRDVRAFAGELRSAAIYTLGLIPALQDLVDSFSATHNTPVSLEVVGIDRERFRIELEVNLYRIAQEALQNAHKHAQATRIDVFLQHADGRIVLTVVDDGRGIALGTLPDTSDGRGLGLIGMRERAAILGGQFEIESVPGQGTSIIVSTPIESRG